MTSRTRAPWVRPSGFVALVVALATLSGCKSCKKETEEPVTAPAPPLGAASSTELTTGLGPARGLDEELVPTSTKWRRAFVLDDKRLVLTGDTPTETIALMTDDAGRTWRALRSPREGWSNWNVAQDGALVLATGARGGGKAVGEGVLDAVKFAFASSDATSLGPANPPFPPPKGALKGKLVVDAAIPALVSPEYASIEAEEGPRRDAVFYGGRPGVNAVPAVKALAGEKLVPVPYGRPPTLLSVRGHDLLVRPWPAPGKPLDRPQKVIGVDATPTLAGELSAAPACDFGELTFQRARQAKGGIVIIAAGNGKATAMPAPETTPQTTSIGCNGARAIVEATDNDKAVVALASCTLAGACAVIKNAPFRPWPEAHDQSIQIAPTDKGMLVALAEKAGSRWGLYMGQSVDGVLFEQSRVVGEGTGDRGRLELGALVPLGGRVLLLLSSDITGTSRRGWYVTVTDDGGVTWNVP